VNATTGAADLSPLRWIESEILASLYDRTGLAGEQYRKMGIKLEGLKEITNSGLSVILVTSPLMGDGKTAVAANLALALANIEGRRVALVDCDLRNPRIWTLFKEPPRAGLIDLLTGKADVESAAARTERVPLEVFALPRSGDRRMEYLPADRFRSVLEQMRKKYDFIVCDSPPVLPVADTAALVRMADGIILIVRAGRTPRPAVSRVLEGIDKSKLVGFVLNAVVGRAVDPYYYPYHGEGGGGQQARDGNRA
jgi:capsular exopolysaccharide synthesis family protein